MHAVVDGDSSLKESSIVHGSDLGGFNIKNNMYKLIECFICGSTKNISTSSKGYLL